MGGWLDRRADDEVYGLRPTQRGAVRVGDEAGEANSTGATLDAELEEVDGIASVQADANIWLQIDEPGVHVIQWAMREDGLEFDKFVMALDPKFVPEGDGPPKTSL